MDRPWRTCHTARLEKVGNDYADFEAWERWMKKKPNDKAALKEMSMYARVVVWAKMCELTANGREG